jgi:hypothetical protein
MEGGKVFLFSRNNVVHLCSPASSYSIGIRVEIFVLLGFNTA